MRIAVLGVGNILLGDEGVGVRVVERLERDYRFPPGVSLIDGGTSGMEMLEDLEGLDKLIMVDAVRAGLAPATPLKLVGNQVPVFFKTKLSPHQVGLSDVLATLALTGNAPGEAVIVGIEPVSLELSLALSPEVEAKLPELVGMVLDELRAAGIEPERVAEVG